VEKNIVLSIRMDLRYRCPLLFKTFLFEFSWTSLAIYDRKIIVCDFNIRHFLYKKFERRCFYTVYMKYIVTTFILTDNIILYLMYNSYGGQSRSWSYGSWIYNHLCNQCLSPLSDKVYHLLAHGRWFSPGTPASSTTKTGRHDIAEILLKVA